MTDMDQRPLIMGIINVTPDSFSGDGIMKNGDYIAAAVDQGARMLEEGAAILDVGGESSRPGSTPIDAAEEIRRVIPVIEKLRQKCGSGFAISVDTIKASVAEAALKSGADIINDISALQDQNMGEVAARHACPIVLMHNRSEAQNFRTDPVAGNIYTAPDYADLIADVKFDLRQSIQYARSMGVADSNIIIDPGLGFGKTPTQNLALIKNIPSLKQLGFPILIGPSRKSFIGKILDLPPEERFEGTASAVALCAFLGSEIIRVHDVKEMSRVARMAAAIRDS